jgi:hypothetical protein
VLLELVVVEQVEREFKVLLADLIYIMVVAAAALVVSVMKLLKVDLGDMVEEVVAEHLQEDLVADKEIKTELMDLQLHLVDHLELQILVEVEDPEEFRGVELYIVEEIKEDLES